MTTNKAKPYRPKPYRPCVGILLTDGAGRIFFARRIGIKDAWQMPQGGIDEGETPRDAARRELKEETGIGDAVFLAESAQWLKYDLPAELAARMWKGRYRGQAQKWFAYRYTGPDDAVDLAAHEQEFDAWRWATPAEVLQTIVPFKKHVYEAVLEEFADHLR